MSKHVGGGWDDEGTRRVAVLWVSEDAVFDASVSWLVERHNPPQCRLRLRSDGIDLRDCDVVRVTHDPMRQAFGFLLRHESFAAVPDGGIPPDLSHNGLRWEWVAVEYPVNVVQTFADDVPGYDKTTTVDGWGREVVTYTERVDTATTVTVCKSCGGGRDPGCYECGGNAHKVPPTTVTDPDAAQTAAFRAASEAVRDTIPVVGYYVDGKVVYTDTRYGPPSPTLPKSDAGAVGNDDEPHIVKGN